MGGLSFYTAPDVVPMQWRPIAGLGCFYDLQFLPNGSSPWSPMQIEVPVTSNCRVSFYASILQTAGNAGTGTAVPSGALLPPEEGFIYANGHSWANGVFYWRVDGRIIFEDDETADLSCGDAALDYGGPTPVGRSTAAGGPVRGGPLT